MSIAEEILEAFYKQEPDELFPDVNDIIDYVKNRILDTEDGEGFQMLIQEAYDDSPDFEFTIAHGVTFMFNDWFHPGYCTKEILSGVSIALLTWDWEAGWTEKYPLPSIQSCSGIVNQILENFGK